MERGTTTDPRSSSRLFKSFYGNFVNAVARIGIAMGPHVWFGNHFFANVSQGGLVEKNEFEGAVSAAYGCTNGCQ